jgi:hypothetical protein
MSNVVKKMKKTLFARIIGKIKNDPAHLEQRDIDRNIPLDNIYTNCGEINTITTRRNELRVAKNSNSDVIIAFEDSV